MNAPRPRRLAALALSAFLGLTLVGCGSFDGDFDFNPRSGGPVPGLSDGPIPREFSAFVDSLWPAAARQGVSRATFEAAFRGVGPDAEALQKASAQPEFERHIWDYLDDMTADSRIAAGQAEMARLKPLLDGIESRYGVERQVVVAIWGIESTYGTIFSDPTKVHNVVRALATLAWKGGSRAAYGRQQLLVVLRILEHHDIDSRRMIGSWAGAMGQTQFIPTTYMAYAVDYDGDGRRDIWNSVPDSLASAANYLKRSGWRTGETWGYEVVLPAGFDTRVSGSVAPLGAWAARGVVRADGSAFPRPADRARLFLPAGASGPAFLTLPNFDVIKRYNAANAYALSVGHLADRLIGGGPIVGRWPRGYEPLDETGRTELQQRLRAAGYPIVKIDGKVGAETISAIRSYEAAHGLPVSGHASLELLTLLRRGG